MTTRSIILTSTLGLAILAGCDNDKPKTPSQNTNTGGTTPTQTTPTPAASTPSKAPDAVVTPIKASDTAAPTTQKAVDAAKTTADTTKTAVDTAKKTATETTAAVKEQAHKLMGEMQTAISSAKWSDVDALITKLDAIKDKLPEDIKAKYESLKKTYTEKKGLLQGIPGLGK